MAKHIHIHLGPGARVTGYTIRARTGDDFQESKHKRDEGGKFSSTGAGGGAEPKVKPGFNQHLSGKLKAKGFAPTKEKAPNGATVWHHAESGVKVHAAGIPEGAKATAISHIGGNMGEAEVLAQRGSRFRVTNIEGTNIHAELLPPKEKKP